MSACLTCYQARSDSVPIPSWVATRLPGAVIGPLLPSQQLTHRSHGALLLRLAVATRRRPVPRCRLFRHGSILVSKVRSLQRTPGRFSSLPLQHVSSRFRSAFVQAPQGRQVESSQDRVTGGVLKGRLLRYRWAHGFATGWQTTRAAREFSGVVGCDVKGSQSRRKPRMASSRTPLARHRAHAARQHLRIGRAQSATAERSTPTLRTRSTPARRVHFRKRHRNVRARQRVLRMLRVLGSVLLAFRCTFSPSRCMPPTATSGSLIGHLRFFEAADLPASLPWLCRRVLKNPELKVAFRICV